MLKEQDIKQYLNEKKYCISPNSSIISVIFPNKFTYALIGIAIIGLNNTTGK